MNRYKFITENSLNKIIDLQTGIVVRSCVGAHVTLREQVRELNKSHKCSLPSYYSRNKELIKTKQRMYYKNNTKRCLESSKKSILKKEKAKKLCIQDDVSKRKLLRDAAYKLLKLNKYYKKILPVKKNCEWCGKEFLGRKNRKYCKKQHSRSLKLSKQFRKRLLKLRTPKWVNKSEIFDIYMNCPDGYEVDHIVPLRNKIVSGLHVPWNLQYLTKEDNMKKSNKLDSY